VATSTNGVNAFIDAVTNTDFYFKYVTDVDATSNCGQVRGYRVEGGHKGGKTKGDDGQTEERIGAPELTHSNGVGCAMRPRPAKDEDVRPEDPEQVVGVRSVQ
jgi:hypothetical protein